MTNLTRGIIMDEDNNWNIVCLPFFKFKDFKKNKEACLKIIDLNSSFIYDMIDGSLAVLYYYNN